MKPLFIIFLLSLFHLLPAQQVDLIRVLDQMTGEPIEGAELFLGEEFLGSTDSTGTWEVSESENAVGIQILPMKIGLAKELSIRAEGYQPRGFRPDPPVLSGIVILTFRLMPLVYDLPDAVSITANRGLLEDLSSPAAISLLSQESLRQNRPRSMAEALIGTPGVWVQKTNHGGGSPFVRGLTGNQTLILVDGIRMNNSTYRYGPNQYLNTVDPLSLQRVEVMRGQGAVQYGTDALGGTVNLLSRSLALSTDGLQVRGNLYGKYLGYDMERTGRAEATVAGENLAVTGGFSYKDFGDLVAGGNLGIEAPSAYDERDADSKLLWKATDQDLVTAVYQRVAQRHVGRYDQVAQRGYAEYEFEPQIRELAYTRWEHFFTNPFLKKLQITGSWQESIEGRSKRKIGDDFRSVERDEVRTLGATAELHTATGNWTGVHGLEWYADAISSWGSVVDTATGDQVFFRGLYPDGSSASQLGLFSLHRYYHPGWEVHAGLRGNVFRMNAMDETFGDLSISPSALVGNAAFLLKPGQGHTVIVSANTGFRAPNINDLSSFGSFDSGIEVPSPDLRPETSRTFEIGYKHNGGFVQWQAYLYQTQLRNLIVRAPATWLGQDSLNGERVYQKENIGSAVIRGAEGIISWQPFPFLNLEGSVTYTFGQDENGGPLRRIPPLNGRFLATWQHTHWWLKGEWLAAAAQTRLSGGDIDDHRIAIGGTPGWQVINLRGGYDWRCLRLSTGLENLFNEAYRIHGSGVDGMGRNAWVALEVIW